jgi:UDP-2,4-diacetamido-2,4,6-trideoxy-beta-L-altropyranose hydrolase
VKKIVKIRADGDAEIGLGHLFRCIALAEMLQKDFSIHFFSLTIPESLQTILLNKGFSFTKMEVERDFMKFLAGDEIVVLDHYQLSSSYQKEVRNKGCKLVCIDDLHEKEFFADLIINHLPGADPKDYKAQSYTNFALGVDYALLRPLFLQKDKGEKGAEAIKSIFICFGGSDIRNLTKQVLGIVCGYSEFEQINVVLGPAYNYLEDLMPNINSDNRVKVFQDLKEDQILQLMKISDLAIVPASGILYEIVATNTPVITGSYVDNQKYFLEQFSRLSSVKSVDNFDKLKLMNAIQEFLSIKKLKTENFIDGESPARIMKKFKQLV